MSCTCSRCRCTLLLDAVLFQAEFSQYCISCCGRYALLLNTVPFQAARHLSVCSLVFLLLTWTQRFTQSQVRSYMHHFLHRLPTNFSPQTVKTLFFFPSKIQISNLIPYSITHLYSRHVIHVCPSLHRSDAKVLPLHNYNFHRPKYEAV